MKALKLVQAASLYLDQRTQLGFKLRADRWALNSLAKYARKRGHRGPLTQDLAVQWAQSSKSTPQNHACRLNIVINFARFWNTLDPRVEVPMKGLLGPTFRRRPVHIYSQQEIGDLLRATSILGNARSLRAANMRTLLGLLVVTGMRVSEALSLRLKDVDLEHNLLTLATSKSGEGRLIPIHRSTARALKAFRKLRDRSGVRAGSSPLFLSIRKDPLPYGTVRDAFLKLRAHLQWSQKPVPRIHDLRHTFAVNHLLKWCQPGKAAGNRVLSLSTYMGHRDIANTYWYFSATPELMSWVSKQLATPTVRKP